MSKFKKYLREKTILNNNVHTIMELFGKKPKYFSIIKRALPTMSESHFDDILKHSNNKKETEKDIDLIKKDYKFYNKYINELVEDCNTLKDIITKILENNYIDPNKTEMNVDKKDWDKMFRKEKIKNIIDDI